MKCLSDQQAERWHPSKPRQWTHCQIQCYQNSVWKAVNTDIKENLDLTQHYVGLYLPRKRTNVTYKCDRPFHFDQCKQTNDPRHRKEIRLFHRRWLRCGAFLQFLKEPYHHKVGGLKKKVKKKKVGFLWNQRKGSKYKLQSTPINNSCIKIEKLYFLRCCAPLSENTHTHTRARAQVQAHTHFTALKDTKDTHVLTFKSTQSCQMTSQRQLACPY